MWRWIKEDVLPWVIGIAVIVGLIALMAKGLVYSINKEKATQYERFVAPIKSYKCHEKGLSILLEDSSGSRNWQFIKDFKCRDQKPVEKPE